ncbi:MAG: hypothetical protein ACOC8B_01395 [Gemmatimonadota bacterium]
MKKLLLFVVLVGLVIGTVPEARERAMPVLRPAGETVARVADVGVSLLVDSVFSWSVERELRGILTRLEQHLIGGGRLPSPSEFPAFLRRNRLGGSIDPWGTPYYIQVTRDSIFVGSAGPDTTRTTDDDIRASIVWTR